MTRYALTALLLAASVAPAAPVPPPVRELTPAIMVGVWKYSFAGLPSVIAFDADGTYLARGPDCPMLYHGTWRADGSALVLEEWQYDLDLCTQTGPITYRYTFSLKGYPYLAGKSDSGNRVVLSEPKR